MNFYCKLLLLIIIITLFIIAITRDNSVPEKFIEKIEDAKSIKLFDTSYCSYAVNKNLNSTSYLIDKTFFYNCIIDAKCNSILFKSLDTGQYVVEVIGDDYVLELAIGRNTPSFRILENNIVYRLPKESEYYKKWQLYRDYIEYSVFLPLRCIGDDSSFTPERIISICNSINSTNDWQENLLDVSLLGYLVPNEEIVVNALINVINNPDKHIFVRKRALWAIDKIGIDNTKVINVKGDIQFTEDLLLIIDKIIEK